MKFNGSSWENVGSAGFSSVAATGTSLAFDSSGTPYVAYTDGGNSSKATVMKYGLPATLPTVTTTSDTEFDPSSATMGGEVTSDGGSTVTGRGVVYSAADSTPTVGESDDVTQVSNGTGTGAFGMLVGSLSPDTILCPRLCDKQRGYLLRIGCGIYDSGSGC